MKNKILKSTLALTLLATSSLLASNTIVDSLGLNLGKSNTNYDQKNTSGTISSNNNPDKTFNSIELYTTLKPILSICKEYNMKSYVSYTFNKNSELKHQYLLVGVNKYFTPTISTAFSLYAGLLAGYGQIDWSYDPLKTSTRKNVDANSFIGGIQVGSIYSLRENLSLNLNAKYLFHNYETNLKTTTPSSATIEHDSTASVAIGLGYRF